MHRMYTLVAMVTLAACGGYEQDKQLAGESSAAVEGSGAPDTFAVRSDITSYEYGKFDSALAKQLEKVFHPKKWRGETDGPVLMSAESLPTLSETQRDALRTILREGHAILVSGVSQEQLARLHALNGSVSAISLDKPAELYVLAAPLGRLRMLAIRSVPSFEPTDDEAHGETYARMVAEWFREHVRTTYESSIASMASVAAEGPANYNVLGSDVNNFPWSHTDFFSMPAFYSDQCSGRKKCTDTFSVTTYSWATHNPRPDVGQPSDFVLMRIAGEVNTAGCKLSIGNNNRFAGYWLRQANVSAKVPDATLVSGVSILSGYSAPQATNPNFEYSKGVTWSFGGSGTISGSVGFSGGKPSAEVTNSLGFSAGVSYSNTTTYTAPAIQITPQVGADPTNPSKVLWNYDSWNHVERNIKPGNHACGGPGLLVGEALPSIIYGATFEPSQEWIWAVKPEVRSALTVNTDGAPVLPVQVDLSMLLGWAYYWDLTQCNLSGNVGGFKLYGKSIDIAGEVPGDPSNGLAFDTGCGTTTMFGTIPLGSYTDGAHNGTNVGAPYPFTFPLSIPLAHDPNPMRLTSMEPKNGPKGTLVTLRGTSLHTTHSVSFGGLPLLPTEMSMMWPQGIDPATGKRHEAYITVVAPDAGYNPAGTKARISVTNAALTSGGTAEFEFTYE